MYLRGQFMPMIILFLFSIPAMAARPAFPALDFYGLTTDRPEEWPTSVHLRHLDLSDAELLKVAEGEWIMNYACGGRPTTINEHARMNEDSDLRWAGLQHFYFSDKSLRQWVIPEGETDRSKIEVDINFKMIREGSRVRVEETSSTLDTIHAVLFGHRRLDEYLDAVQIEETGEIVLRMSYVMGRFSYICGKEDLIKIFTRPSNYSN